ncbi:hypothetical protein D3C73_1269500 [compost metagenome]
MYLAFGHFRCWRSRTSLNWVTRSSRRLPAKSPEPLALQKVQPPLAMEPSRFGQVKPASSMTLNTLVSITSRIS